ncbi:RipA family octameric membrane protein [Paraclostridium bifermentans]|uniref:RipA family octameric membrane protein n=1 Tax=Paraclostridium bifermentans TaxID=1490 RepID=UPI00374F5BC8
MSTSDGAVSSNRESEYGDLYKEHKFRQYEMFITSASEISKNRMNANKFFMTINSFLLTAFGLFIEKLSWATWILPVLGIIISIVWFSTIKNYSTLNSAKFTVINDIEEELPVEPYKKEWEIIKDNSKYKTLSKVEQKIPFSFGSIFAILILIQICILHIK